jgi:hypothetical protein
MLLWLRALATKTAELLQAADEGFLGFGSRWSAFKACYGPAVYQPPVG